MILILCSHKQQQAIKHCLTYKNYEVLEVLLASVAEYYPVCPLVFNVFVKDNETHFLQRKLQRNEAATLESVKQRLMKDIKPFMGNRAWEEEEPPKKKKKRNEIN